METVDINQAVMESLHTPGAILLDVRTPQEYREGHLPGSRNLPLQSIGDADGMISDEDTPIFVYCQSRARSSRAAIALREMGYSNIKDLGGITAYKGNLEV